MKKYFILFILIVVLGLVLYETNAYMLYYRWSNGNEVSGNCQGYYLSGSISVCPERIIERFVYVGDEVNIKFKFARSLFTDMSLFAEGVPEDAIFMDKGGGRAILKWIAPDLPKEAAVYVTAINDVGDIFVQVAVLKMPCEFANNCVEDYMGVGGSL